MSDQQGSTPTLGQRRWDWTAWWQERWFQVVTTVVGMVVAAVITYYAGVSALREQVTANSREYEKRLVLVEQELQQIRKSLEIEKDIRQVVLLSTRQEEAELVSQVRALLDKATRRQRDQSSGR